MDELLTYINSLSPVERKSFAEYCETSIGYLRKAISKREKLNAELCIRIEAFTKHKIKVEQLRPDVDWATVRKYCCKNTKRQ